MSIKSELKKAKKLEKKSLEKTLPFELETDKELAYYSLNKDTLRVLRLPYDRSHSCTVALYNETGKMDSSPVLRCSVTVVDLKDDRTVYLKTLLDPKDRQIELLNDHAFSYLEKAGIIENTEIIAINEIIKLEKCPCGCNSYMTNMVKQADFIKIMQNK